MDATQTLIDARRGDRVAVDQLLPLVYEQLRERAEKLLSQERKGHTLQPTALVHEVYLRLIDRTRVQLEDEVHFLALASRSMRRVLIDHARRRGAVKRGGGAARVAFDEFLAGRIDATEALVLFDDLLEQLSTLDERKASVVEMKLFGGLDDDRVGKALNIAPKTVEKDWYFARAWLESKLTG